tara:strand:- start:5615 stop:6007 length:393 start_codon:yes stop_codon:yes gene_type:complete
MTLKIQNIFIFNQIPIDKIKEVTDYLECKEYLSINIDTMEMDQMTKYPCLVVKNKPSVSWLRVKKVFFLTSVGWIEKEDCEKMIEEGYDFHNMNDIKPLAHRIDHEILDSGICTFKFDKIERKKVLQWIK